MKRLLGVLFPLGVLLAFLSGVGALGAYTLQQVLPWSGGYGRAALWGLVELGFVGLSFFVSIRNRIGFAVFLATLPVGALWAVGVLWVFRLRAAAPGPYAFSIAFTVSFVVAALAVVALSTAGKRKGQRPDSQVH